MISSKYSDQVYSANLSIAGEYEQFLNSASAYESINVKRFSTLFIFIYLQMTKATSATNTLCFYFS